MIGTTLAQYRVTAELGAGGMGEVWRAEDTKLGREVALKVLPEEFAKDPERMARFSQRCTGLSKPLSSRASKASRGIPLIQRMFRVPSILRRIWGVLLLAELRRRSLRMTGEWSLFLLWNL